MKRTKAEKQIYTAFENNGESCYRVDLKKQKIRSEFLQKLFSNELQEWKPRRLVIHNARISGELKLDNQEILHPIHFSQCKFEEGILMMNATIPSFVLEDCIIHGKLCEANGLRKSTSLNAEGVKANIIVLRRTDFLKGSIRLFAAEIKGMLDLRGSYAQEGIFASTAQIGGLKACTDKGDEKKFRSDGRISLINAEIKGETDFSGSKIRGGISAERIKTGKMKMADGFLCKGEIKLRNAEISETLNCNGGTFEEGIDAEYIKTGNIQMNGGLYSKSTINLTGVNVQGQIILTEATIDGAIMIKGERIGLVAQGAKAEDVIIRKGFQSKYKVSLLGSIIRERIECNEAEFKRGLILKDTKANSFLYKNPKSEKNTLDLSGFQYNRLHGEIGENSRKAIQWLEESQEKFEPQPYEQAMTAYRNMGRADRARRIGYKLESKRHRHHREMRPEDNLFDRIRRWTWWSWGWIMKGTIGYGYRPFRSIICALILWGAMMGTLCWWPNAELKPTDPEVIIALGPEGKTTGSEAIITLGPKGKKSLKGYPEPNKLVYATEVVIPVINLGQTEKFHLEGAPNCIQKLITFTSSLLLAILTFFGIGALGTKRKAGGTSNEEDQ